MVRSMERIHVVVVALLVGALGGVSGYTSVCVAALPGTKATLTKRLGIVYIFAPG